MPPFVPLTRTVAWLALGPMAVVPPLAADANDSGAGVLEEVVVTARKMAEPLQSVPVAVTAIEQQTIEDLRLRSLGDIAKVTAGLVYDPELGRGSDRPVIRGQANILGESGVSYFIDGVYINTSIADFDLNEVERIEVVKGPQSALYGRNTYAGAINIITRSPGAKRTGRVRMDISSDHQGEVAASFQSPLTDTLSGGLNLRHFEADGAFTNSWDGSRLGEQQTDALSAVLAWEPDAPFRARARAWVNHRSDGQPPITRSDTVDNNCFFDTGSGLYAGAGRYYCGVVPNRPLNTDWPRQVPGAGEDSRDSGLSLRLDGEFNRRWSWASITGYNRQDRDALSDADYSPSSFNTVNLTTNGFPFSGFEDGPPFVYAWVHTGSYGDFTSSTTLRRRDLSQELRFEFQGDRLRALLGAYGFDESRDTLNTREYPDNAASMGLAGYLAEQQRMEAVCAANPLCEAIFNLSASGPPALAPLNRNANELDIRNAALFGLLATDLGDHWRLTLEARWQRERIRQRATAQVEGQAPTNITQAEATFDAFLPRLTVDWQAGPNVLLYALYARGTKPGGLNSAAGIEAGLPRYDEEDVSSIEFGAKQRWSDGRLQANVAVYFNQVDGYQLTQAVQGAGRAITATVNAGDADIRGLELELRALPRDELTLTLNYAWNDSEFTRGVDANQGVLEDVADNGAVDCSTGNQFPDLPGCTSLYGSIVGKLVPRTAEHQWFADVEWRQALGGSGWEGLAGLSWVYESSKYSQVHNLAETGDTSMLHARLGMSRGPWSIQLQGRNLTGEDSWLNVLRYLEPRFTRAFGLSARRDTWYGLSAIYRW